jgi:integrase
VRGHIRKRGSTWLFVHELPRDPATGKRRRAWSGGYRTRRAAEVALAESLSRLDGSEYVELTKQTVGEYLLETWLPAVEITLKPSTLSGYRSVVEVQVVPRLRSLPLQKLTTAHLNKLYGALSARGRSSNGGPLAPRTVRLCHTIIRKALADAVRWGLLVRNVAIAADPPSAALARADAARRRKPWSVEDLQTVLRHVARHRLYAAFLLAATTGMRRGELLGLRWCDLDLPGRRLSIVQTLIAPRYRVQVSTPKTDSGTRAIALDAGTIAALEHHRMLQQTERALLGIEWTEDGLVFTTEDAQPLKPALFTRAFQKQAKDAGVPVIRLHDVRHTHATIALQHAVHPKVVQERLGHRSITVTLDTYSHVIPTLQESAAEMIGSVIISPPDPVDLPRRRR